MNEIERAITAIEESMKDVLTTMQGFRFYAVIENALVTSLVALREKAERDHPKPLTVDDLKERDGKPVCIQSKKEKTSKTYCIMPEMPYCPCCEFGYIDTHNAETYDDLFDCAPLYCTCTKEKYEEYLILHGKEDKQ